MLKSRKTDLADCDSMVERSESFNAARVVGEPQAATGLNECTSEGSGWRRMPKPRKAWLLPCNKPPKRCIPILFVLK